MIDKLKSYSELQPFFTTTLLENGVGVIIDPSVNEEHYLAINVDNYYHHLGLSIIPAIVDLIIVGKEDSLDNFHIFVVEMKNISSSNGFDRKNIYAKFETAINDFMKKKYADPFLADCYNVVEFKLFFIADAYHFIERGIKEEDYDSFLKGTKIEVLQGMTPFEYKGKFYIIDYKIPNPLLKW